eukprot:Nitzschia sp. Nitz4//scaffold555_size3186//2114//2392//NITZ4_009277-RA/size3186-exonerate_est2genome-gene-0.1-mRNA-1//1//CDS//3329554444//5602//frame0
MVVASIQLIVYRICHQTIRTSHSCDKGSPRCWYITQLIGYQGHVLEKTRSCKRSMFGPSGCSLIDVIHTFFFFWFVGWTRNKMNVTGWIGLLD